MQYEYVNNENKSSTSFVDYISSYQDGCKWETNVSYNQNHDIHTKLGQFPYVLWHNYQTFNNPRKCKIWRETKMKFCKVMVTTFLWYETLQRQQDKASKMTFLPQIIRYTSLTLTGNEKETKWWNETKQWIGCLLRELQNKKYIERSGKNI